MYSIFLMAFVSRTIKSILQYNDIASQVSYGSVFYKIPEFVGRGGWHKYPQSLRVLVLALCSMGHGESKSFHNFAPMYEKNRRPYVDVFLFG